jgi:hypothetical protein
VSTRRLDSLTVANLAFVVAMALHAIDHTRQGRGLEALTREVRWGGVALAVVAVGALLLTLRHSPFAPLVATVVGFGTAIAVTASHLVPHWSALSDPYAGLGLGLYSWAVVLAEVVTALLLGIAGLVELRRQQRAPARAGF